MDSFNAVEWTILTELPVRVLASAIRAGNTGEIGRFMQQTIGLSELSTRANEYADSELVQAVFEHYKSSGRGEAQTLQLSEQWLERLVPDTIERARQAAEILEENALPDDAMAYKLWLLKTAAVVCASSRTGGFLGIRGERIDTGERQYLDGLAAAFGLPVDSEDENPTIQ